MGKNSKQFKSFDFHDFHLLNLKTTLGILEASAAGRHWFIKILFLLLESSSIKATFRLYKICALEIYCGTVYSMKNREKY